MNKAIYDFYLKSLLLKSDETFDYQSWSMERDNLGIKSSGSARLEDEVFQLALKDYITIKNSSLYKELKEYLRASLK